MTREMDLLDGVFTVETSNRMLLGHCAMIFDRELMYAGRIENSPNPQTGWLVVLHPDDFEEIDARYRKEMN